MERVATLGSRERLCKPLCQESWSDLGRGCRTSDGASRRSIYSLHNCADKACAQHLVRKVDRAVCAFQPMVRRDKLGCRQRPYITTWHISKPRLSILMLGKSFLVLLLSVHFEVHDVSLVLGNALIYFLTTLSYSFKARLDMNVYDY